MSISVPFARNSKEEFRSLFTPFAQISWDHYRDPSRGTPYYWCSSTYFPNGSNSSHCARLPPHLEKAFRERILGHFGTPRTFVCDNGTQFTSRSFKELCKRVMQIEHTAPYSPHQNLTDLNIPGTSYPQGCRLRKTAASPMPRDSVQLGH